MGIPDKIDINNESNLISKSEKKRLESIKQKKELFKSKELAVHNALKNLDNKKTSNNKIIFENCEDEAAEPDTIKTVKKTKFDLFDDANSDDDTNADADDSKWDISNFETDKRGHTVTLGNDKRFKIDERFLDNESPSDNDTAEISNETNLHKEKEMQMDILENILGKPIKKTNETSKDKLARKQMIRYDPTESNHKEYEIVPQNSESNAKKTKKKKTAKDIQDNVETNPIEVSKDIYFSVSKTLTTSLKEGGQFSLLGTFGKEEVNEKKEQEYNAETIDSSNGKRSQLNFTKNPFKYDTSDEEDEVADENNKEMTVKMDEPAIVKKEKQKLFFDGNDERFSEAITFFSKESMPRDEFNNLRRELKQIVRLKIRRNTKKREPYGQKKRMLKPIVAKRNKRT